MQLHKLKKTKNPKRIQINCLSPLVVSSNFLTVQLWLSYVSWCFHDHWAYLIVINFRHILKPIRDFINLRWWRRQCWCTSLPMGITDFPYAVSLSTRIPFYNDLAKPHKAFFIRSDEPLFHIPLSYSMHRGDSYCSVCNHDCLYQFWFINSKEK